MHDAGSVLLIGTYGDLPVLLGTNGYLFPIAVHCHRRRARSLGSFVQVGERVDAHPLVIDYLLREVGDSYPQAERSFRHFPLSLLRLQIAAQKLGCIFLGCTLRLLYLSLHVNFVRANVARLLVWAVGLLHLRHHRHSYGW